MRRRGVAMSWVSGRGGWGWSHVDIIGAADRVSQLSCVSDSVVVVRGGVSVGCVASWLCLSSQ